MAAIIRLTSLAALVALVVGLAACGRVPAAGGQAATPSAAGRVPSATAGAAAAVTAVPPRGSGSASAGTGSAGPANTTAGPAPTVSPLPPTGTVLTVADNGAVVDLRVGQRVTVVLTPANMAWHLPAAAGAALRLVSSGGGFPGRQPAQAVFLAVAPGTAVLTSETDGACLHAHPLCMAARRSWHVTVRVSGA